MALWKIHRPETGSGSPPPISSTCRFAGEKRNIIMAVGRWDDLLYKRPCLLMSTLEQAHALSGS